MALGLAADVRRGLGSAREALLLEGAERRARGYDAATHARISRFETAARERERAARDIASEPSLGVVATLLLEALVLRATAFAAACRARTDGAALAAPSAAEVLAAATPEELGARPTDLDRALELLRDPDPLRVERLTVLERDAAVTALEHALVWVRAGYEPRRASELGWLRWSRLAATAGLLACFIAGAVVLASGAENVARGKRVRASSQARGSARTSAIVDGVRSRDSGFRTGRDAMPWVELDLEREYQISEIVVYPAGGKLPSGLPLTLEVARTTNVWHELSTMKRPFSELSPWRARARGETARYVRVLGASGQALSLSEIEVYGEPR